VIATAKALSLIRYNDFEIVAANLLDGESRRVTDRILCYGVFIDPPLGRVGLTESEARATGRKVRIGSRPMTRVNRAVEKGESQGFMRIVVDALDRVIPDASCFVSRRFSSTR
jgi:pyruvate/2-oxoglutarate dehydrogenase complex dihydrolipoamide dehydrogenase (E3) component